MILTINTSIESAKPNANALSKFSFTNIVNGITNAKIDGIRKLNPFKLNISIALRHKNYIINMNFERQK